ncbi:hypothetical protein CHS0354_041307 [Potamilus streckersoni]|uniref:Uncharacterized protein n=1 Tax=Potamilus streckersoni TaxID=2493646 RepID=A0AAE0SEI0_9BIVA|nr:hypothetical protein CHS0354_041307 [Potamilus streckersoni]
MQKQIESKHYYLLWRHTVAWPYLKRYRTGANFVKGCVPCGANLVIINSFDNYCCYSHGSRCSTSLAIWKRSWNGMADQKARLRGRNSGADKAVLSGVNRQRGQRPHFFGGKCGGCLGRELHL